MKVLRGVCDLKAFDLGLSNTTTAADLLIIYEKLAMGEIVNNEGYQWRHDWKYNENTFIDLKRKPLKYTNISLGTMKRMIESYNMKELTHIVAYSQNIEHDYKIGDKLTFEFLGMLPFRKAYDWRHVKNDGLSYLSVFNLQTV